MIQWRLTRYIEFAYDQKDPIKKYQLQIILWRMAITRKLGSNIPLTYILKMNYNKFNLPENTRIFGCI